MANINWTKVDEVTTVWTEAPAPIRAGLYFRTGRVDETLATSGQTHLIEHMSLSAVSDYQPQHNGLVGGVFTGFFTLGGPHEVSNFLARVCDALGSLPGDRLDEEKQILAAESAARQYDSRTNMLTWRYGASGYGLIGLPELGLQKVTLEQLRNYAAQRFTSENAILWLSGPLPDDLRLGLPHGTKLPIPPITPIPRALPGWFGDDRCGGIAVGATVPRIFAATIFCEIASKRLLKRLRLDQAISYAPSVFYEPLNADTAHLVLYADSETAHRVELVNIFGEIFEGLGDIEDAEVEAARSKIIEHQLGSLAPSPADISVLEVQRAAMDWIMGGKFEPLETFSAQYRSVTAGDIAKLVGDMQTTAMFVLPAEVPVLPCFGRRLSVSKGPAVNGQTVINLDAPIIQEQLVYGPNGVSYLWPNGSHSTVRYSDLAAVLCYKDGGIRLIGTDAATIMIEPTIWRDGQSICLNICKQVPAQLLIDQPARPENIIPKPTTTHWQRFRARLKQTYLGPNGRLQKIPKIIYWIIFAATLIGFIWLILIGLFYK